MTCVTGRNLDEAIAAAMRSVRALQDWYCFVFFWPEYVRATGRSELSEALRQREGR